MIRLVALLLLGTALASCGTYQANVGKVVDMIPEWARDRQPPSSPTPSRASIRAYCLLLPPSPPAKEATTSQDKARQGCSRFRQNRSGTLCPAWGVPAQPNYGNGRGRNRRSSTQASVRSDKWISPQLKS
jgi:hypothetical protein